MMRIRNLKVWFPLRRGLARELMGGKAMWVRALDGVSFDVKRGEVFCLVGESGCGKTTTGKALLRLVDATEGDIFLEMPEAEYDRYASLKDQPTSPENAEQIHGLQRKFSLTWKERLPWSLVQRLIVAAFLGAGALAAIFAPALLAGVFAQPYANAGVVLFLCVLAGAVLGVIGTLPPSRPSKWTPSMAAIISLFAFIAIPLVTAWLIPGAVPEQVSDPLGTLGVVWGEASFAMLIGLVFVAVVAGGTARILLSSRSDREGLRGIRVRTLRRRLHLIFQDPYESLNPKQSVFEIVSEPLAVNRVSRDPEEIASLVSHSLEDAGLRPAEEFMFRFPHELSGGQRQRVSIAAALALEPDFIVADEPVSMLDVSIRTEILDLMMDLRTRRGITYLFITHDLGLAWILADRIAVMYLGKIVEQGTAEDVIAHPKHPYTQALISVVPSPDPRHVAKRTILKGERPDPVNIPTGCRFHPRCPMAFEKCGWNAEEAKETLETLLSGQVAGGAATMTVPDPHTLRIAAPGGNPEPLAESIRSLAAERRPDALSLRGIAEVSTAGTDVVIRMHPWSEPELQLVGPDNTVACYLVSPAPTPAETPSIQAA